MASSAWDSAHLICDIPSITLAEDVGGGDNIVHGLVKKGLAEAVKFVLEVRATDTW